MKINIYKLLKLATGKLLPGRLKIAGLWLMHISRRRMLGIFMDPADACNLRCKMCYMSIAAERAKHKGLISDTILAQLPKSLYHRTLKLQLGCGAEPTLYPNLQQIVEQAHAAGVPYISLVTNGLRIADGHVDLDKLCEAGLNELILSMHGTNAASYEELMTGASFEQFKKLIAISEQCRQKYPGFVIRINYTINSLNVDDLADDSFWNLWASKGPDIIQLRPVQNMGETEWDDFSLDKIKALYDKTIGRFIEECKKRGILCLAPSLEQLDAVDNTQDSTSSTIEDLTYCYISPTVVYKDDFDPSKDTYESYHRRVATSGKLLRHIFGRNASRNRNVSKKLNYTVK